MTYTQWQNFARNIRERAQQLETSKKNEARELAHKNGLDPSCIHNAAIDTELTGWCYRHPERLKIARQVEHALGDFSISHLADRIIDRQYKKLAL